MKPPRFALSNGPQTGLARALSKLGFCSRSEAWRLIESGRVRLNGVPCRNAERPVDLRRDRVEVDGKPVAAARKIHLALNKPRGLVTTTSDERGRDTVYECFEGASLPFLSPVGRLDQASEGLLLFTNDTAWAAAITAPETHLDKTYHVQIDCVPDEALLLRLREGVSSDGERLGVKRVTILRQGTRNAWLEILLDEGRNRHIRRLLEAHNISVLRLVRVAISSLQLGNLAKGAWRELTPAEVSALSRVTTGAARPHR